MNMNLLRQYLKTGFRVFLKYKIQLSIAILGLAFSLVCFIPTVYWLHYETTYDRFYSDAKEIYRIYAVEKGSGKVNEQVPGLLGNELLKYFPILEATAGFVTEQLDYQTEENDYIQLKTLCVDSAFLNVFQQPCVYGDMKQALQMAGNIVLTETVASRLFGTAEKAIGQKLEHSLSRIFGPCTVTAVVQDSPANTNLPFDAIFNFPALQDASMIMSTSEQWQYYNNNLYVKFYPQANSKGFEQQLRNFTSRTNKNTDIELRMLPISDVRHKLNSDQLFTLNFIRLLVISSILLMLSALFNFLNLYLGLFRQRINEFRQRMIHGATSRQIITQMMFELTCVVLSALLIGTFFIFLTRPVASNLLGIVMPTPQLIYFSLLSGLGIMLFVLLFSLIPCWRMNQLITRNMTERKASNQPMLQRIAISFQLAVSIVFIIAASVTMMQMRFINQKDLGFDRGGIIQLYSENMKLDEHKATIKQRLEAIPQIMNISATDYSPDKNATVTTEVEWPGKQLHKKPVFQWLFADANFAKTFRLKLIAGRWWEEGQNENHKVVLNEEAVKVMGLSEPIGSIIRMNPFLITNDGVAPMEEYEVIGVVNDFHSHSLRSRIHPTIIRTGLENIWYIRVVPGQEQEVMQRISSILTDIDIRLTDTRLTLLDEVYDRLDYSEQIGLKLFFILAIVCLSISLFGIYAIARSTTQKRRKEIAIRKIFGADIQNVVRMFVCEYSLLVVFAAAVALPIAHYVMYRWLHGYAYHTNIPWWLPVMVFTGSITLVLFTVLGQVLKAAGSNPAKVIKSE